MNWKMVLFFGGGLGCWWIKNYIQPPRASWRIIQWFLSANQGLNDTRIQCWNSSGCNLANNETGVVHTPSNIKKYSINTAVSNVFFCRTKCVFILRFSSTSAYGILDSDSSATGVTWCYTLKIRLDVRASACIAALAMLLVPGCFGFY